MYCGGAPDGPVDPLLACPACRIPMDRIDDRGLLLDRCPTCGGTWYDRGELEAQLARRAQLDGRPPPPKVVAAAAPAARSVTAVPADAGSCPRCDAPLVTRDPGRSGLRGCRTHGVFLPSGMLETMVEARKQERVAQAGLHAPQPPLEVASAASRDSGVRLGMEAVELGLDIVGVLLDLF
jgi:Zn-finger nucleic acid-binding protein